MAASCVLTVLEGKSSTPVSFHHFETSFSFTFLKLPSPISLSLSLSLSLIPHFISTLSPEDCIKGLSEEGMPMYKRPELKGNLYFEFEIEFPDSTFFSDPDKLAVCFN